MSDWESPPYDAVAAIYDRLMGDIFDDRQRPLLDEAIEHFKIRGTDWADVACGTGTVACHLARLGWRVHGSDVSEAMLSVARRKAEAEGSAPDWSRQDMRRLTTPVRCDAASCFFDSINIMTRKSDLASAFRAVARALKPGGHYLFDSIAPRQTRRLWDYCDRIHEGDGYFGFWEVKNTSAHNVMTVLMRWFIERGDGLYVRADETHRVRGYTRDEIAQALGEAGLELVAAFEGDRGFLAPLTPKTMRIDYVARKESG